LDLSKQTPLGREARYKQGLTLFRQAEMAGDFLREGSPALEELRQAQKIFKELATVSLDPMLASKNLLLAAQTDCLCNESSVLFSGLSELELRNRRCFDLMADPLLVRYFSRAPDRIPLIQAFRAEKFQATHRWLDGLLAWKRIETFSGTPAETARQLDLFLQEFETFPSLVALALERRAGLLSLEKEADRKGFSEWLLQWQAKAPGQILAEARMRALLVTALLEKGLLLEAEKCLEEMPGRSWLPARERGELENLNVRLLLCQNRREAAVARMRKWFEEGVPPVLAWPVEFATLSGEECEALSLAVAKKNLALRQMLTALSAGTEKKFRFRELLELCSRETAP